MTDTQAAGVRKTLLPALAQMSGVQTLPDLFDRRIVLTPNGEAYRQFDEASGSWRSLTWRQTGELVARWRRALVAQGLQAGARVAILVPNGIDHVCMDLAALSLGMVPVPLHSVNNPGSIAYILQDSASAVLLLDHIDTWNAIAATGEAMPDLQKVVVAGALPAGSSAQLVQLEDWLKAGDVSAAQSAGLRQPAIDPDALAAIVYTSGTTGHPKGVMLSHSNVVSNLMAVLEGFEVKTDDVLLSFLPLSHTFERTVGYYLPIAAGACVAYARSVALLQEDLHIVKPTVLVSVPRIYERIYAKVREAAHNSGALSLAMIHAVERVGWNLFTAGQHKRAAGLLDRLAWLVLEPLVARKVRDIFGGRLRVAVAGGAPLGDNVARFFLGVGINVLQGYGMTETSPIVCYNTPDDNDPSSVGKALPGVKVRLGDNDELMVQGPNVMLGYWNRQADTQRVLTEDRWLHTGDQARINDEGRIYITGRIKDIIVTSTGEKISPSDLELAIMADSLFSQVLVVGEQRPFLSILAVIDEKTFHREAPQAGIDVQAPDALTSEITLNWALARITHRVRNFPHYATPKKVWLTRDAWTIDAGLMTPTLKLKRPALEKRFAAEIEQMYARRA